MGNIQKKATVKFDSSHFHEFFGLDFFKFSDIKFFSELRKNIYKPKANSNFCVKVASLEGVGTGSGLVGTKLFIFKSSGLDLSMLISEFVFWAFGMLCIAGGKNNN